MGRMKELQFLLQNEPRGGGDLSDLAAALSGEQTSPRAVRAPSPGCSADDRSMTVFIDPAFPERFWIYAVEGSLAKAKAHIRDKLSLVEPAQGDAQERSATALRIWNESVPAAGTLVETYLRSRAITLPVPDVIRFHGALWHAETRDKRPAMVGLVTDINGVACAVHRTWLRRDGSGKAAVEPDKKALGPTKGCAIRLAPAAEHIAVGEGIETCLSVMLTGQPVWSALNAPGMRALFLPAEVRRVTLLVDGDDEGERAAQAAAVRWRGQGREVLLARAPRGMDFNDVLKERES
jgi:hypothetical protein